jgi:hypothetical protein
MINLDFHENAAAPHQKTSSEPHIKEVFHISHNSYTYEEAPAVCAAYGAELASFDQLQEAFSLVLNGVHMDGLQVEWLYILLKNLHGQHYNKNHKKVKELHVVILVVNGGYFDPKLKFGVNCYGVKPRNKGEKFPQPLPTEDTKKFDDMVKKFKNMLGSIKLSGFNRNVWSEKGEFKLPTSLSVPI